MLCTEFLCAAREKNRSQFDNLILERTLLVWWPFINDRDSARVFFLFGYKLALVDRFHRIFSQPSTCALFLLLWHFRKICTTAFAERRVRQLVCWQILITICSWTHWVHKSIKQWRLQMVDIWEGQLLNYWETQLHEKESKFTKATRWQEEHFRRQPGKQKVMAI